METSGASTTSSSPPQDLNAIWGMPQKNYSYFNFVVADRKKYVPGSGPPLQPITAALKHDKTGYIIDKVFFKTKLRYLVGFKDEPQLKVSVRPQNILEWVSEWEAEDWEERDYIQKEKEEVVRILPKILAKEAKRKRELEKESRESSVKIDGRKRKRTKSSVAQPLKKKVGTGRGRGRPPLVSFSSKMPSLLGPGQRNQYSEKQIARPITSPKSQRRAGTGLAHIVDPLSDSNDSDSEDDSEDTDTAINAQLNYDQTDIDSESPDPLMNEAAGMKNFGSAVSSLKDRQFSSFVDHSAVATASAYEAGQMWDTLTKEAEHRSSLEKHSPSIENSMSKCRSPRSNQTHMFEQKDSTSSSFGGEEAMMSRVEKEANSKMNKPMPQEARQYIDPFSIVRDVGNRQEIQDRAKATRLSTKPQDTFASAMNPKQDQSQRSPHPHIYKYKSPFDNPIKNKAHRSPYENSQMSSKQQSEITKSM